METTDAYAPNRGSHDHDGWRERCLMLPKGSGIKAQSTTNRSGLAQSKPRIRQPIGGVPSQFAHPLNLVGGATPSDHQLRYHLEISFSVRATPWVP